MPIDGNIAIASYGLTQGDVVLDNSLPIEDLDARLNLFAAGYFRSFSLFNRLTKFDVVVPYAYGHFNGKVEDEPRSVLRNGLGDPSLRLSMLLIGSGPMKPQEYYKSVQKNFKLGIAMRVNVPLGQYNPEKLINLGTNRWALRTALAGSYTLMNKLVLEAHFTSWFYGDNDEFLVDSTSSQEPLFGGQIHATYIFKPGVWLAGSIGGVNGGVVKIDGEEKPAQNNNRYGLAFAYRVSKHSSLKLAWTNALITTFGGDFNSLLLAYQFIWFDKK